MEYKFCDKTDMKAVAEMEEKYIECPWSENTLLESFGQDSYVFIKAEEDGILVGYGSVQIILDEGNINNIAVSENFRNRGIASGILNNIISCCKDRGVTVMFLEVNEHNVGAIALYTKFGFGKIGERKNYYKSGNAIIMSLKL
ncbi:MAG: ribosomal protein S18-alanine N-acetyltransferase [Clostridia bacterium]|nr:ribosomal protein S18-alanine N-acetyltransferase [Clostridia bacterium]